MTQTNWKRILGQQLLEFRQKAHGGKGITLLKAGETIGLSRTYVNRLEIQMEVENPTLDQLDKLCTLYGREIGELFEGIVPARVKSWKDSNLHIKLDEILAHGKYARAIEGNIIAMWNDSAGKPHRGKKPQI